MKVEIMKHKGNHRVYGRNILTIILLHFGTGITNLIRKIPLQLYIENEK